MFNAQRQIKKIMTITDRNKREVALRELAMKLGCSLSSTYTLGDKHSKAVTFGLCWPDKGSTMPEEYQRTHK